MNATQTQTTCQSATALVTILLKIEEASSQVIELVNLPGRRGISPKIILLFTAVQEH